MRKEDDLLAVLLGDVPEPGEVGARKIAEEAHDGYRLETLLLEWDGERIPACVALPMEGEGPYPLVVFNHSHGGNYANGRNELIRGAAYLQPPSFS
ncbi:hypothetical protein ACFSL6_19470 [Paenibacillus thailandensis]|uniref:Uncharacterized protein n=1 Tax=Paenibacillus thailandensis TaxID=393250 RepID=A0ABW5QUH9_9BACL